MRLIKGLYSDKPDQVGLFGLKHCQQSPNDRDVVIRDAGWFNHVGECLGQGDISAQNTFDIMCGIADDELFVVLESKDRLTSDIDWRYVANHSRIIFEHGHIYQVDKQMASAFSTGFYRQYMHTIDRVKAQMVFARFIMKQIAKGG